MLRLPLAAVLLFTRCGLPRDGDRTLDGVRGGVSIGAIVNPPWVVDSGGTLAGVEAALLKDLAAQLRRPERDARPR